MVTKAEFVERYNRVRGKHATFADRINALMVAPMVEPPCINVIEPLPDELVKKWNLQYVGVKTTETGSHHCYVAEAKAETDSGQSLTANDDLLRQFAQFLRATNTNVQPPDDADAEDWDTCLLYKFYEYSTRDEA